MHFDARQFLHRRAAGEDDNPVAEPFDLHPSADDTTTAAPEF